MKTIITAIAVACLLPSCSVTLRPDGSKEVIVDAVAVAQVISSHTKGVEIKVEK